MTLTIDLSAETEAKLRERACTLDQDVAALVAQAIEEKLAAPPANPGRVPAAKWSAEWRAWAASHRTLDNVADDSRESIYAGRGE